MMAHLMRIFVIAVIVLSCEGQLADILFPNVAKTTRQITDILSEQSLLAQAAKITGDLITSSVKTITALPLAIAKFIGVSGDSPSIINDKNYADITDTLLAEYRAGLDNEDASLSVGELIQKYGYPMEEHETVTEDGYVLTMFRIPSNGTSVFLMHGLLGSADDYVVAGPESSLAYSLSQEGYDVWMGNARGNKHSRRHIKMKPSEAVFWNFSWHEIGYYDLPAMIDHVLNITNGKTLKYIGHSQGTTSFFVMGSMRSEYNKKVALMVALSPVAFMSNAKSPFIRLLAPGTSFFERVLKRLGLYEFLPDATITRFFKVMLCGTGPLAEIMCSNMLMLTCGFDIAEVNVTNLPVVYGHVPSGASTKQFTHYSQGFLSGDFKQFDYGSEKNLEKYGSEVPPSYPLEKVQAPVSLFYSDADWMSHPDDVDKLYQELGNAVDIYKIRHDQFNHLDFIWAKHIKKLVFERLQKLLKAF